MINFGEKEGFRIETVKDEDFKITVKYFADYNDVEAAEKAVISGFKNEEIAGFRKGKAPESLIRKKIGKDLRKIAFESIRTTILSDICKELKIKPITSPIYDNIILEGRPSCEVSFYYSPIINIEDPVVEVPYPGINMDIDGEVEKTIRNLRLKLGDRRPAEDHEVVESGDSIKISFTSLIDGKDFDNSSAENMLYFVGDNSLVGIDDNVIGLASGESKKFSYTLNTGSVVDYDVTVVSIQKSSLRDMDESFAKDLGEESVEAVENKIRTLVANRIKKNFLSDVRGKVILKLLELYDFPVPDFTVNLEAENICRTIGVSLDDLNEERKSDILREANGRVRLSVIVDSIRDKFPQSVLNDVDAFSQLSKQVSAGLYGEEKDITKYNQGAIRTLMAELKDEFVLQWVIDKAKLLK